MYYSDNPVVARKGSAKIKCSITTNLADIFTAIVM